MLRSPPLTFDLFHRLYGYSIPHSLHPTTHHVQLGPPLLVTACSPHAVGLLTSRIHLTLYTQHIPQLTPPGANVAPQPRLPSKLTCQSIAELCRQIYRREPRARSTISCQYVRSVLSVTWKVRPLAIWLSPAAYGAAVRATRIRELRDRRSAR